MSTPPTPDDEPTTHDIDLPPPAPVPTSWLHRHLGLVLGAFAVALAGAFVLIALLLSQLASTRDELATTRTDLERVEAGADLFASQVTGFQEQLVALSPTISAGLDEAVVGLDAFGTSTLEFNVAIDENVAIDTEVVIDHISKDELISADYDFERAEQLITSWKQFLEDNQD